MADELLRTAAPVATGSVSSSTKQAALPAAVSAGGVYKIPSGVSGGVAKGGGGIGDSEVFEEGAEWEEERHLDNAVYLFYK